jgi:hypothetical protein
MTLSEKRSIWAMPCAVCGCAGLTEADHITPKSKGGSNDRSNFQPLCTQCNAKKRNRLTNSELLEWVLSRGGAHYQRHRYLFYTRTHVNFDDQLSFFEWRARFEPWSVNACFDLEVAA